MPTGLSRGTTGGLRLFSRTNAMLVSASSSNFSSPRSLTPKGFNRIVFYGETVQELRSFFSKGNVENQKLTYDGRLAVFSGRYEKTLSSKTTAYDPHSFRMYNARGLSNLVGTPGLSEGIEHGMKAVGLIQTRQFIAIYCYSSEISGDVPAPQFFQHQKSCRLDGTFLPADPSSRRSTSLKDVFAITGYGQADRASSGLVKYRSKHEKVKTKNRKNTVMRRVLGLK